MSVVQLAFFLLLYIGHAAILCGRFKLDLVFLGSFVLCMFFFQVELV